LTNTQTNRTLSEADHHISYTVCSLDPTTPQYQLKSPWKNIYLSTFVQPAYFSRVTVGQAGSLKGLPRKLSDGWDKLFYKLDTVSDA